MKYDDRLDGFTPEVYEKLAEGYTEDNKSVNNVPFGDSTTQEDLSGTNSVFRPFGLDEDLSENVIENTNLNAIEAKLFGQESDFVYTQVENNDNLIEGVNMIKNDNVNSNSSAFNETSFVYSQVNVAEDSNDRAFGGTQDLETWQTPNYDMNNGNNNLYDSDSVVDSASIDKNVQARNRLGLNADYKYGQVHNDFDDESSQVWNENDDDFIQVVAPTPQVSYAGLNDRERGILNDLILDLRQYYNDDYGLNEYLNGQVKEIERPILYFVSKYRILSKIVNLLCSIFDKARLSRELNSLVASLISVSKIVNSKS